MKTKAILLFFILISMVLSTGFISPASQLIGTITSMVETIQEYPAAINDAYCTGDMDAYRQKLGEMASLIVSANHAMEAAKLPNTLNLWAVYSAVIRNLSCGGILEATGYADWSREELDRIGYKYGLYDTVTVRSIVVPQDPCDLRDGAWMPGSLCDPDPTLDDPCVIDSTSAGCPDDPCVLDPSSDGCPEDPCVIDPSSEGCPDYDLCESDPGAMGCPDHPCTINPQSSADCPEYNPCLAEPVTDPACDNFDPCLYDVPGYECLT